MAEMYKTEREARLDFVACCMRYAGIKEGGADHKALLIWYNTGELPRGYKMTVKDPWCAAFLSAIAKKLGYERFPVECSCKEMLYKAERMGLKTYGRGYEPGIGDLLIYDLNKNGEIDHIGAVAWIEGDYIWIVEGNYGDSVKMRKIHIDDPRIYAWICPDYMERVDNSNWVGGDRPNIPIEIPESEEEDMNKYKSVDEMPEWAREGVQKLVDLGIIEGVGDGDLGMNLTETRLAVWLWRGMKAIAKLICVNL